MCGQKWTVERWGDSPSDETTRTQVSHCILSLPHEHTYPAGFLPHPPENLLPECDKQHLPGGMRTNSQAAWCSLLQLPAIAKSSYPYTWGTSLGCLRPSKTPPWEVPRAGVTSYRGLLPSRLYTPWSRPNICGWTLLFFPSHPAPPKDQENMHPDYIIITFNLKEFLWSY